MMSRVKASLKNLEFLIKASQLKWLISLDLFSHQLQVHKRTSNDIPPKAMRKASSMITKERPTSTSNETSPSTTNSKVQPQQKSKEPKTHPSSVFTPNNRTIVQRRSKRA
jgi:hypothetical protein